MNKIYKDENTLVCKYMETFDIYDAYVYLNIDVVVHTPKNAKEYTVKCY